MKNLSMITAIITIILNTLSVSAQTIPPSQTLQPKDILEQLKPILINLAPVASKLPGGTTTDGTINTGRPPALDTTSSNGRPPALDTISSTGRPQALETTSSDGIKDSDGIVRRPKYSPGGTIYPPNWPNHFIISDYYKHCHYACGHKEAVPIFYTTAGQCEPLEISLEPNYPLTLNPTKVGDCCCYRDLPFN